MPTSDIYKMRAKVWIYNGKAAWHFVTLPKKQSALIKKTYGAFEVGWGSLHVIATVGKTSWKTSIFADGKRNAYLLPLKTAVRKKETIRGGDTIQFTIEIKV